MLSIKDASTVIPEIFWWKVHSIPSDLFLHMHADYPVDVIPARQILSRRIDASRRIHSLRQRRGLLLRPPQTIRF